MGPNLWSVATGDGGSGLGEVMQDWCQLIVRLVGGGGGGGGGQG